MLLDSVGRDKRKGGDHDYKSYVYRLSRSGNYFIVPRRYLLTFKARTALLLLHLLNCGQASRDDDGYIPATSDFVAKGIGIDADTQDVILTKLKRLGIVETQKRGFRQMRHIRINLDVLEDVLALEGLNGKAV
jgi:hypothetical protein